MLSLCINEGLIQRNDGTRNTSKRKSQRNVYYSQFHMEEHNNRCSHHRIDHCEWPQCNPTCPSLYNLGNNHVDYRAMLVRLAESEMSENNGNEGDDLLQMLLQRNDAQ